MTNGKLASFLHKNHFIISNESPINSSFLASNSDVALDTSFMVSCWDCRASACSGELPHRRARAWSMDRNKFFGLDNLLSRFREQCSLNILFLHLYRNILHATRICCISFFRDNSSPSSDQNPIFRYSNYRHRPRHCADVL